MNIPYPGVLKPRPNCRFLTSATRCPLCGTDMRAKPEDKIDGFVAGMTLAAIISGVIE